MVEVSSLLTFSEDEKKELNNIFDRLTGISTREETREFVETIIETDDEGNETKRTITKQITILIIEVTTYSIEDIILEWSSLSESIFNNCLVRSLIFERRSCFFLDCEVGIGNLRIMLSL